MGIWGPDSPRWVLWSGIVVGIWYVVMMFLVIKMSHRWTETSMEGVIIGGLIAAIGLVTIAGCIYRLRKPKAA
jgi:membrane-associated HD superfamily phosphohydrolase